MKNLFREYAPAAFKISKKKTVEKTPIKKVIIEYLLPLKLLAAVATHVIQKTQTKGLKILIIKPKVD